MYRQGNTNIPDRDDCKGIIAGCIGCDFTCRVDFYEIVDDVVTDNIIDTETQCDIWPVPAAQFRNGKICHHATHLAKERAKLLGLKEPKQKIRVGQQKQTKRKNK